MTAAPTAQVKPGSLVDRLLTYYQQHPGMHRCMDVGRAVGLPTHRTAVLSMRLSERGAIERRLVRTSGRRTPVSLYGIPNQNQETRP